jgi:Tol biopolymer transport system component
MQPGQYLLVQDSEYLYVVSEDSQVAKKLALDSSLSSDTNYSASSDGTRFLILRRSPEKSYAFDLITGESTELDINQQCIDASWSPDKQLVAISCITDEMGIEINILDTVSGRLTQITHCEEIYKLCSQVAWSPDGQWLAFHQRDTRSGEHPNEIVIFPERCINSEDCADKVARFTGVNSEPNWSQKNQLVFVSSGMISYFELKGGSPNQVSSFLLPNVQSDVDVTFFRVSPDGNYVAYSPFGEPTIYLYSRLANQSKLPIKTNRTLEPIGWLTIP